MDTKVLSTGVLYTNLPESYIRPESERPRLSEVSDCEDVPVIDLGCEDRSQVIKQIAEACKTYGFFQVPPFYKITQIVKNFHFFICMLLYIDVFVTLSEFWSMYGFN